MKLTCRFMPFLVFATLILEMPLAALPIPTRACDAEEEPECTPILIDLENDGVRLTGLEDPVWFDIDANGEPNLMSWTDGGEGFLVLDRNGNGRIDDGGELFGNATRLADGNLASNGYEALAELDSSFLGGNGDHVIDSFDFGFPALEVWTDGNHDGISQAEELQTLAATGIQRIGLDHRRSSRMDRHGNRFVYFGRAWKTNQNGGVQPVLTWDVVFLVEP